MPYTADYDVSQNGTVNKQVRIAVIKAATAIQGEDPAALGAVQATKRATLAKAIIDGTANESSKGVDSVIQSFQNVLAANGVATVPLAEDSAIDAGVASYWDDIAGVDNADLT